MRDKTPPAVDLVRPGTSDENHHDVDQYDKHGEDAVSLGNSEDDDYEGEGHYSSESDEDSDGLQSENGEDSNTSGSEQEGHNDDSEDEEIIDVHKLRELQRDPKVKKLLDIMYQQDQRNRAGSVN